MTSNFDNVSGSGNDPLRLNPVRLAALIRFHLSEMGARNAHHEFEHLARHVARARIASNILPATGPVSSGGDGGRDFETFASRLAPLSGTQGGFAARSTGERTLIFASSLETKIEAKIRKDIDAAGKHGGVDEIVYFCEQNLAIGKRLRLIKQAEAKNVKLQVFDGAAIAEWLAEPDIFWIAQEYLHLPAEVAPAGELDKDYQGRREAWRTRMPLPVSRADFLAIKVGLRRATFDETAKPDLGFWLDKMAAFLSEQAPRDLARNAMYETAVANLRGRCDMTPADHLVADYFGDVGEHAAIGEITDAVVLLTYAISGSRLHQYRTDEAALFQRRRELVSLFEEWLADPAIGPGRRSGLLRMRGVLEFTPAAPGEQPDPEKAFALWGEMLTHAAQAPLLPIEEFSDHLSQIIEVRGATDGLLDLAARADELLAQRAGDAAAGEKAVDRAFALFERDEPVAAIRELHRAKAKWFSGEHLGGALRLLLLLAESYGRLGLAYASKYHSMAAAQIARHERPDRTADMVVRSILGIVDAEDAAGNTLGFMQLFPVLLAAHLEHDHQPLDMTAHPHLQENFGQLAGLLGLLNRVDADARKRLDALMAPWPREISDPIRQAAKRRSGFWNKGSWEETWASLEEAFLDRPFGDLGPTRCVQWGALGIEWRCEFANDYATTPSAEQLIAELQLAACAMGGRDLGIVPGTITLRIATDDAATALSVAIVPDTRCVIDVTLPASDRPPEDSKDSVMLFLTVGRSFSALKHDALIATFDRSVFDPIFVARPYAELYREFVPLDLFAEAERSSLGPFQPAFEFVPRHANQVPWFDGLGPTYDGVEARLDIEHRYQVTLLSLRHTLERIKRDPMAMARLWRLHDRGMKDWEILSILGNVALNHRLAADGQVNPERLRELGELLFKTPEAPEASLDPALFDDEQLEVASMSYLAAFLNGRNLLAPECLDFAELERFLATRYRLRDDDVEHGDPFGWALTAPPSS
ncbi:MULTISPECIES: hypothetical protein [unclassified Sphingomonas]|uniref:hypothetical protein n=1 Tax=unclassified Sphingomonas TaxID=196159 RepID=UPI002269D835|nr:MULTISPECIES: hypothetical protein [unclassified Sphingomonas]